jgi:hypothetical protein
MPALTVPVNSLISRKLYRNIRYNINAKIVRVVKICRTCCIHITINGAGVWNAWMFLLTLSFFYLIVTDNRIKGDLRHAI